MENLLINFFKDLSFKDKEDMESDLEKCEERVKALATKGKSSKQDELVEAILEQVKLLNKDIKENYDKTKGAIEGNVSGECNNDGCKKIEQLELTLFELDDEVDKVLKCNIGIYGIKGKKCPNCKKRTKVTLPKEYGPGIINELKKVAIGQDRNYKCKKDNDAAYTFDDADPNICQDMYCEKCYDHLCRLCIQPFHGDSCEAITTKVFQYNSCL